MSSFLSSSGAGAPQPLPSDIRTYASQHAHAPELFNQLLFNYYQPAEPQTRSRTLLFLSIRDSRAPSSRFNKSRSRRLPPTRRRPKHAINANADPFVIYNAEEDEEDDDNDDDDDDNGNENDSERVQLLGKQRAKPIGGHVAIDIDESAALPPAW